MFWFRWGDKWPVVWFIEVVDTGGGDSVRSRGRQWVWFRHLCLFQIPVLLHLSSRVNVGLLFTVKHIFIHATPSFPAADATTGKEAGLKATGRKLMDL